MKRILRTGLFILIIMILLFEGCAFAAGNMAESITLNQVQQNGPDLTMYVNLYDEGGYPVTGDFEPEDFAISIDGVGATVDSVRAYDPQTQGIHYVFVVDVSLSVTDGMMESVRNALHTCVDKMGPNDTVTIYTFGEWVTELLQNSGDKQQIQNTISDIYPAQNWTALYEGVIKGAKAASGDRSAVVVITDGKNDLPDPSTSPTKEDIFAQIESAQVPLYCVGLNDNDGVNKESLQELANATGGAEFDGPASDVGSDLDAIYNIICGAVELHGTMTNPEGKTGFSETSTFLVGFQTERNFITSNEIKQVVNWTRVPGPQDATPTPVPTARPEITPPPTAVPTVAPTPEKIEEPPKSDIDLRILAVGVALVLVIILVILVVLSRRKKVQTDQANRSNEVDHEEKTEISGEDTVYDEPAGGMSNLKSNGRNERSDDFIHEERQTSRPFDESSIVPDDSRRESTAFLGQSDWTEEKTVLLEQENEEEQMGLAVTIQEKDDKGQNRNSFSFRLGIGEEMIIGRAPNKGVAIKDVAISKKHAKFTFNGDGLYLYDLNSTNGTRVNGKRLNIEEAYRLTSGDVILLGTTALKVEFGEPEMYVETGTEYEDPLSAIHYRNTQIASFEAEIEHLKTQQATEEEERRQALQKREEAEWLAREQAKQALRGAQQEQRQNAAAASLTYSAPTEIKYCNACGKANEMDADFCIYCGHSFQVEVLKTPAETIQPEVPPADVTQPEVATDSNQNEGKN